MRNLNLMHQYKPKLLSVFILIANSQFSIALPTGGSGTGTTITNTATTMNVDVTDQGQYANVDWATFDVGANETVTFEQFNSESVVLNNINDTNASEIFGTINGNGHVFLINQNGFVFSENATISAQGFLASTYSATINEATHELSLSGGTDGVTGAITLENINIEDTANYIAFYSPNINIGNSETTTLNLGSGDAYFNTSDYGTITLPGLSVGFKVNPEDITDNLTESINLDGDTLATASGNDSSIIITQTDINSLLNSSVNIPEQLSANSLQFNSESAITLQASQNQSYNGTDVENIKFETHCGDNTCDITFNSGIYGSQINLELVAGNGLSSVITNDSDSEYNFLGGINGLNSLSINAANFYLENSLISRQLNVTGNMSITSNIGDDELRLSSSGSINIDGNINFVNNPNIDVEIFTPDLSFNGIDAGANNINIYTDQLTTQGTINFNTTFELNTFSDSVTNLTLLGDLTFIGNEVILEDTVLSSSLPNEEFNLTFGNTLNEVSSVSLANISTEDATSLDTLRFYTTGDANIQIDGALTLSNFIITNDDATQSPSIILDNDLTLSGLNSIDTGNALVESVLYDFYIQGDGSAGSIANIHNIDTVGFSLKNFETTNLTGDFITTTSGGLLIDSTNLNITSSGSSFEFTSTSGEFDFSSEINANHLDISLTTETGIINLNGISNAANISMSQSSLSSVTHIFNGSYIATDDISLNGLGDITNNSSLSFSGNNIDLAGTQISATDTFTIEALTSTLGRVNAANININGPTSETGTTSLTDDLIASDAINFNLANIELLSDTTLTGNLNILNEKEYNDEGELRYTNLDGTLGDKVANIYGTEDLIIQASNSDVYLYNIGSSSPLSSLILTGIDENHSGNLYFIDKPSIAGTRGLTVTGDWQWTEEGPIEYITDNYNLDLSGVTINAEGSITFDTGSGDLSLGSIGTNGAVTDLIIESAGTLSLYGEIALTDSEFGYIFDQVNAIELYTDLVLGSEDTPAIVDFGNTTIDGTYSLTIYSDELTLGTIGSNIALQNLNIYSTSDLTINNDISLVGSANINANSLALNSNLTTSGLDINISTLENLAMNKSASISAENGNILLSSTLGNIGLGTLVADNLIEIRSETGFIYNSINDYISDSNTSINLTSSELSLTGELNIGESVANPIVIDITNNGTINLSSSGDVYIANLANASVVGSSRVFDSSSVGDTAIVDAYNQLQLSSLSNFIEPTHTTTFGLIDHINWQTLDDEVIRKIKRPTSAPNLYRGRGGWRLGY